ncbi:MAG: hypothetical protein HFH24_07790 [Ruminococcus sp.]|nr:hypothetical protein [Ruminococcus sp.]
MKKHEAKKMQAIKFCMFTAVILMLYQTPVFAAEDPTAIIDSGFDVIYNIIAAIVSALGTIYLLWGVFEWSQSLNTQDGGAQSIAFKRIAAGIVAMLAPQLIPLISSAV